MSPIHQVEEAYEIYGYPDGGRYVFSCEHASNRLPNFIHPTTQDKKLLHTHWAWDIGARALTMELARQTKSIAVLSRFSRLVCDPNRHLNRADLIRAEADGHKISFNTQVDEAEAAFRIDQYYNPYHDALHRVITQRKQQNKPPFLFVSVHSFTPVWNTNIRTMDVGILFDTYPELAEELQKNLREENLFVAMNEPYSGKFGLMYAADRHGTGNAIQHLEFEFNQAILCTEQRVAFVAPKIIRALDRLELT